MQHVGAQIALRAQPIAAVRQPSLEACDERIEEQERREQQQRVVGGSRRCDARSEIPARRAERESAERRHEEREDHERRGAAYHGAAYPPGVRSKLGTPGGRWWKPCLSIVKITICGPA